MRRVLSWLGASAALGLLVWAGFAGERPAGPSCKPEAPIAVALQADGGSGGRLRAAFSLRPVLELTELRWAWELSPDVRLVEGQAGGSGAGAMGALTEGEVALNVPGDGRHHTARLVVTGLLARGGEPDQPEPVTVVRTLSWGEPEPVAPMVLSPDADSGTLVRVAVVPTTHVPAPASAPAGRK